MSTEPTTATETEFDPDDYPIYPGSVADLDPSLIATPTAADLAREHAIDAVIQWWDNGQLVYQDERTAAASLVDFFAAQGLTIAGPGQCVIPASTMREIRRAIECSTVLAAPRLLGIVDDALSGPTLENEQ